MALTSRERVIKVINHEEPDRVPLDFNPLFDCYISLKKFLEMDFPENVSPNFAMEVVPNIQVLKRLNIDLISVKLGSPKSKNKRIRTDGLLQDEWGILYKRVPSPGGGSYLEVVEAPLKNARIKDLEKYPWPEPDLPGRGEGAEQNAKKIFEDTDLAIIGRFGGPITETALNMMGMETWMTRLALDPEFIAALLSKITEIQITFDRIGLEATAKYLQIFKASGEDLGMQTGPLYSPKMFTNQILPYLSKRFHAARKYLDEVNPSVKIMLHSCGSIKRFIPDLIAAGIDILDPIQPHAAEMNAHDLKTKFGESLVFHGGIDIQEVLPFGTNDEIRDEVMEKICSLGAGGGYILAPAHNVQADVPPQNLVHLYDCAIRYGQYPIHG